MANEPKDPKIVSGGEVTFEGSTPQADSLDGIVQAAAPGSASVAADWELENMKFLAAHLVELLGTNFSPPARDVIPYVTRGVIIKDVDLVSKCQLTIVSEVRAGVIRPFLEWAYGAELAQTGIYDAVGLQNDANLVKLAELLHYFLEFNPIVRLDKTFHLVRTNPYQPLLAFPIESRAFFTGAIRKAGYSSGSTDTEIDTWHIPTTLKDVLTYAQKVNQLPKVKEYMDILNKVKGEQ